MPTPKDKFYTTEQIAREIGVSAQRVNQIANSRNITPMQRVGNAKLWAARDLSRFARRPPGRPITI